MLHKTIKKVCKAKIIFALFLLFVVFSFYSYSQQQSEHSAFRNRPSLSIFVYKIQKSITSSFDIDVVLSNLTNKAIDVMNIKILLPQSIKSIRKNKIDKLTEDDFLLEKYPHQISEGSERIYRLNIPIAQLPFIESLFNLETLFFLPGTYKIRSEVIFRESGTEADQSIYETYELDLEPPLGALLRGGILGAFLLALFVPFYRLLRNMNRRKIKIKEIVLQSLIFFIAGSIVSIATILLLQRLGDLNLPITIVVNDWLGGVVVGLFSYTIGDVLYRKFFGLEHSSSSRTKTESKK